MSDVPEALQVVQYPYSRLFATTVLTTCASVGAILAVLFLSIYTASLAGWIESFDWTTQLIEAVTFALTGQDSNSATEGASARESNPGGVTLACLYLGPPNCDSPEIRIPERDNINPTYNF